jgi:hypothetical protein
MFADLDASLQALLTAPEAPEDLRSADISFVTPDKDYRPGQPTINAYLHEVNENRALRDQTRELGRVGDVWSSKPPVLRVDCTYLITAWSPDTAGLKVSAEHRMLGLALIWLSRFPLIPERFLTGLLKTPQQPYPVPAVVAQTHEGQQMGHFWTALGTPPRPGFSVTLTISVEPFDEVEEFAVVKRFDLGTVSLEPLTLQGRVLDHRLTAAAGVMVDVVGASVSSMTDAGGRFSLPGLDPGDHTLRVRVTGAPDLDVPVTYADRQQFHRIVLPAP